MLDTKIRPQAASEAGPSQPAQNIAVGTEDGGQHRFNTLGAT